MAEKSGAGGRGLCGLPPRLEGEPGLGLPFRSAGSKAMCEGGGLGSSAEVLDGDHGLVGEARPDGDIGSGGGSGLEGDSDGIG